MGMRFAPGSRAGWAVLATVLCACGPLFGDAGGDAGGNDSGIPDGEYCNEAASWPEAWATLETRVLNLVDDQRRLGADCGEEGSFPPTAPLVMSGALRCAARAHAMDMSERDFFDHVNPDGDGPVERIERAGYVWSAAGENIAAGAPTPEMVMMLWMASDGHCTNIMSDAYTDIGVGYYEGDSQYSPAWTQVFGAPR